MLPRFPNLAFFVACYLYLFCQITTPYPSPYHLIAYHSFKPKTSWPQGDLQHAGVELAEPTREVLEINPFRLLTLYLSFPLDGKRDYD